LEADLVEALQRLRDPLHHQEQRRERNRGAERPHDRAPRCLLGELVDLEGVPGIVDADQHQGDQRRIEEHEVRNEVDPAFLALGKLLPQHVRANVRALVQRVGAAEHEGGAVGHVARLEHPDRRRVEEVAREALVADRRHEPQHRQRDQLSGELGEAVDRPDDAVKRRWKIAHRAARIAGARPSGLADTFGKLRYMLLAFVVAYLLATIAIGLWAARRVKNTADFAVAGRHLPLVMIVTTTFATWFGSETVLGIPAKFVDGGLKAVVEDPFGSSLCLVLVGVFFAGRLYRMTLLTISDYY